MFQKIKDKIFKILFQQRWNELYISSSTFAGLSFDLTRAQNEIKILEKELKKYSIPPPTIADLMRANLGLEQIDFVNVDDKGHPPHFLNTELKETRDMYLAQLEQIWNLEVWHAMCKYHIDTQGNFSFREADGELQILAGRMSVNGISLLRNEVKKGHEEYADRSKPPEEFDEHELGEGIINNIINKDNTI